MTLKQSYKLAILAISVIWLSSLKIAFAIEELKVGIIFPEIDPNYKGINLAFKEYNGKPERLVDYSSIKPESLKDSVCEVDIDKFIGQQRLLVLLGAVNDECTTRIVAEHQILLVLRPDTSTTTLPGNSKIIVLPPSNPLKEEDIKGFQEKYRGFSGSEIPPEGEAKRIYRAYDATIAFMKVVEKSNLLEKLKQGQTVETSRTEFSNWLKRVRVVETVVAPLREGTPDQQNPANNPIKDDIVLKKGERVIVVEENQPLKNWTKVELFSDSTKVGWIQNMLISE